MTRFSAPSPWPIAVGMSSDAAGEPAAWVAGDVAPLVAAPPDGADVAPLGPHAAATSATTASPPPNLLWNIRPPLSAARVTPGLGACAVASRPAAQVDPVRRAPPLTMYAGSAA